MTSSLLDDPGNEVVQDSEDEEYLSASLTDLVKASTSRVSSIQTAAFSPIANRPRGVSPSKDKLSISSFTHTGKSSTGKDPAPVYERPRPRRVMPKSKQDANSSIQSSIADTSINIAATTSIADFSTSPNMMGIAERAKLRARNTAQATASSSIYTSPLTTSHSKHRTSTIIDVIELTSDSDRDELSLSPVSSKSKPKRNAKSVNSSSNTNKRNKTFHSSHSLRPTSPVIPTIPVLPSSGLPPSDPPPPTSTYELPPIAVLENPDSSLDLDMDPGNSDAGRGLSPLFSQETANLLNKPRQARKRKRPVFEDDDEFGVDADANVQNLPPPALPAPPPPFFAGSSSSVASAPIDASTEISAASKNTKKRKATADDDDYSVMDDFDQRPKPAAKAKKPRGKGKKVVVGDNVEVVIEFKAKGKAKAKASAKGKGKGKEKEKEVYKSREFINDEDDDDDDSNQKIIDAGIVAPSKPDSTISLTSVVGFGAEAARPAATKDVEAPDKTDRGDTAEGEDGQPLGTVIVQKKAGKANGTARGKGKGRQVIASDDDDEDRGATLEKDTRVKEKPCAKAKGKGRMPPPPDPDSVSDDERTSKVKEGDEIVKENVVPNSVPVTPKPAPLTSRYSIGSRTKSTPMSDLIRRVNSLPGSPFVSSPIPGTSKSKATSTSTLFPSGGGTAYSPYLKASKSLLSRIAPLHANIRTPKPPPPPVKKQKTKKEKEREEKWEEEMIESVGGVSEWACLTDAERKEMRRAKWEMELGGYED